MKVTLAYFKVQSQSLPGRAKEYHVNPQTCLCPGQDLKQTPPEYNSTPLPLTKPL